MINISEDDSIGSYLLNFHLDFTTYGDLFDGMNFQEDLEKKAYLVGKGKIPTQKYILSLHPRKEQKR